MSNEDNQRVVRFTSLKLMAEVRDKLRLLKKELGFANYNALLNYMALELTKGEAIPPASYAQVFRDNRPVVLTGQSGAGKTTTVKELLKGWKGNVFLIDVRDEYRELSQIDLGKFFSLRWERQNQRIRFVPSPNREASRGEGTAIFAHLIFVMGSGALKDWAVIIEEGHRFEGDANLRGLLIEARKFVRKVIVVTTDWRVYGDVARIFKPAPWASN
ncbi:MAG: hypothetical protein ABSB56_04535 [Nitrososphaerales archaeon]|jgi:hypothetical protein